MSGGSPLPWRRRVVGVPRCLRDSTEGKNYAGGYRQRSVSAPPPKTATVSHTDIFDRKRRYVTSLNERIGDFRSGAGDGGRSVSRVCREKFVADYCERFATQTEVHFCSIAQQEFGTLGRNLRSSLLHAYHAYQAVRQQAGRFASKAESYSTRRTRTHLPVKAAETASQCMPEHASCPPHRQGGTNLLCRVHA